MTPENAFALSRAYQLYFKDQFDFLKYKGKITTAPLIQQRDRQFYHRIANHLDDDSIHALFITSYFYNPKAYISDLVSHEQFASAVAFASRGQNGRPLFEAELYELVKQFQTDDIRDWLYGEGEAIPPSLQDIIRKDISLDIACMLLLIPQPHIQYDWTSYWSQRPDAKMGLGASPWIDRLKKVDQLLFIRQPGWRALSRALAQEFWAGIGENTMAPVEQNHTTLFS